jgi:hypothetical protein
MAQKVKDPFRLSVSPEVPLGFLKFQAQGLLLGSCFATEVGERLINDGFDVLVNPYGTAYNPITTLQSLTLTWPQVQASLVERDGGITSHLLHSDMWGKDEKSLQSIFQNKREELLNYLKNATWLSITLGTAWVYNRLSDNLLCANLHKKPSQEFTKRLLSVDEIMEAWNKFYLLIQSIGNNTIIVTVSPVIHGKDGLVDNSLSKSVLRLAAQKKAEKEGIHYFPSLEIIRDELRDYRFYAEDMQHPSKQAIDIVYQRFVDYSLDKKCESDLQEYRAIRQFATHKPTVINTQLYEQKLLKLQQLMVHDKNKESLAKQLNQYLLIS